MTQQFYVLWENAKKNTADETRHSHTDSYTKTTEQHPWISAKSGETLHKSVNLHTDKQNCVMSVTHAVRIGRDGSERGR